MGKQNGAATLEGRLAVSHKDGCRITLQLPYLGILPIDLKTHVHTNPAYNGSISFSHNQ